MAESVVGLWMDGQRRWVLVRNLEWEEVGKIKTTSVCVWRHFGLTTEKLIGLSPVTM